MISLGIEGTAHTISCGIVDDTRVLSNFSKTYHNPAGGIHPREAAVHHSENVKDVIMNALSSANLTLADIDIISFSRGPGLGPCLRVVATAARTLAIKGGKPLIGVNHPLGHVEIGRKVTGALDPIMLYVSGGNTQIISHWAGRYRVLGETMDIGIGNMLDKLGRDLGFPFPGGPQIEKLASKGDKLLDLPYSVKGMDTSFSGIYTAAKEYLRKGKSKEDVCFSVQEYSFAMLLEVLERGLHQTSKDEILLAGGVAKNLRLKEMLSSLSSDLGIRAYLTADQYCMDNGAMIAEAGRLMHESGYRIEIAASTVDQRFRIDQVDVPWIPANRNMVSENRGAESVIEVQPYLGRDSIRKTRVSKTYRNPELDRRIRIERLRNEVSLILRSRDAGIPVPVVYDIDSESCSAVYERIRGSTLRTRLASKICKDDVTGQLGEYVARLHSNGMTHGDLTCSNILVSEEGIPYLIDTSMGKADSEVEDMAVDLYLLRESLNSVSDRPETLMDKFKNSYSSVFSRWSEVLDAVNELEKRRRYV